MRLLITGVTGFVGRHLVTYCQSIDQYEIFGIARKSVDDLTCSVTAVDLLDTERLTEVLCIINPERIVHLAGFASVADSFSNPANAWTGNLQAALSLYQAIAAWGGRPRILFVGSGAAYGNSLANADPCTESTIFLPDHPYAASKAAADLASYQAFCFPGLPIIRVRPFNQIGPGQGSGYSISGFAERIARMEAGLVPPLLSTANLDMERDMTDVRDMVRAYQGLLELGKPGEAYNAATGKPVLMRKATQQLISKAKIQIELAEDRSRTRPADVQQMKVSIDRLQQAIGWEPQVPFEQSLSDILDDWRRRIHLTH